jgi:hypothetical protein
MKEDRWEDLKRFFERVPPPSPKEVAWQAIEFAYDTLARTKDRKPRRKAFKLSAIPTLTRHEVSDIEYETWARTKKWWGG